MIHDINSKAVLEAAAGMGLIVGGATPNARGMAERVFDLIGQLEPEFPGTRDFMVTAVAKFRATLMERKVPDSVMVISVMMFASNLLLLFRTLQIANDEGHEVSPQMQDVIAQAEEVARRRYGG